MLGTPECLSNKPVYATLPAWLNDYGQHITMHFAIEWETLANTHRLKEQIRELCNYTSKSAFNYPSPVLRKLKWKRGIDTNRI